MSMVIPIDDEPVSGELRDTEKTIREKIIHVLTVYPKISVSMLQVGVGTSLMPALWKPILSDLIKEGIIKEERVQHTTPTNRQQTYTVLSLTTAAFIS